MDSFDLLRALQAALGIGLVIFVHELGHFLAARICKVRVETFSLGFGPRLLGWRRGPTMYQIALVPLGGYCRMAGEERRWDGLKPAADELPAKSVGARFFIYSAGVLMNLAFALITYPIIFSVGVSFTVPRIGDVASGGPAWHAGVKPGSEVISVNGNSIYEFPQIGTEVALAATAENVLVVRDPDTGEQTTHTLLSETDPTTGLPGIAVLPAFDRDDERNLILHIEEESPAWNAGLRSGDRLIEVIGSSPGIAIEEQLDELYSGAGTATLVVQSGEGQRTVSIEPEMVQTDARRIGISPPQNLVVGIRASSMGLGLKKNDRLVSVEGHPILRRGDFARALADIEGEVDLVIERDVSGSSGSNAASDTVHFIALPAPSLETAQRWADDIAFGSDVSSAAVVVLAGGPADRAGIRDGDVVREVDDSEIGGWEDTFAFVREAAKSDRTVTLALERGDPAGGPPTYPTISVKAEAVEAPLYGFGQTYAHYTYRSESFADAVQFGVYTSGKMMAQLWVMLKKLVSGDIPAKNLGGIITIGRVSYTLANAGLPKFFFFLCFLSMNLAILNVLPIPVLDGGHLFFLLIEKIKGSPVSERVFGYSQMVGVVLILSLLVYVTYHDVLRVIGS